MMKKFASTGLALGLLLGGGTASFAQDDSTTVDLSTKLNAAIENNETVTSAEFAAWAEANHWEMSDLQAWAKAKGMTESEIQAWAEENGWSEEDSSSLDLNLDASLNLDNILDRNDNDHWEEDENDDEGILDDILGDLL
ncbi:hypothetical protein P4V41_17810 [Fictibacillus nanhaiensis]|uniref:hypothetical protein n=1 Tax=Fictibacillus nanhaiensis TaxID=742169 RepID=UPI002E212D2F|nr:hypothetical protein [Fictibacillus nanhaiensis]